MPLRPRVPLQHRPRRTLSQRAIDRVRRVLAARRHHTENAELAAAIKFTQRGKRRSSPLRTEARLDTRVPGALWQVLPLCVPKTASLIAARSCQFTVGAHQRARPQPYTNYRADAAYNDHQSFSVFSSRHVTLRL